VPCHVNPKHSCALFLRDTCEPDEGDVPGTGPPIPWRQGRSVLRSTVQRAAFTGEKLETLCLLLQRAQPASDDGATQISKIQKGTRSHGGALPNSRQSKPAPYLPAWAVYVGVRITTSFKPFGGASIKLRVKKDLDFCFAKKTTRTARGWRKGRKRGELINSTQRTARGHRLAPKLGRKQMRVTDRDKLELVLERCL
jgi:hypothetical protein